MAIETGAYESRAQCRGRGEETQQRHRTARLMVSFRSPIALIRQACFQLPAAPACRSSQHYKSSGKHRSSACWRSGQTHAPHAKAMEVEKRMFANFITKIFNPGMAETPETADWSRELLLRRMENIQGF
ncbi:unnamed protein product [Urochloa humidicola]